MAANVPVWGQMEPIDLQEKSQGDISEVKILLTRPVGPTNPPLDAEAKVFSSLTHSAVVRKELRSS